MDLFRSMDRREALRRNWRGPAPRPPTSPRSSGATPTSPWAPGRSSPPPWARSCGWASIRSRRSGRRPPPRRPATDRRLWPPPIHRDSVADPTRPRSRTRSEPRTAAPHATAGLVLAGLLPRRRAWWPPWPPPARSSESAVTLQRGSAMTPASIKPTGPLASLDLLHVRAGTIERVEEVAGSRKLVRLSSTSATTAGRSSPASSSSGRTRKRSRDGRPLRRQPRTAPDDPRVSQAMLSDLGYADGVTPALAVPERPVPDGTRAGCSAGGRS